MKYQLFILAVILSCSSGFGQERIIEKIDFGLKYKFSLEIEKRVAKDTVSWKYQKSASEYAKKGDYKNALIHWDLAMGTRDNNYSPTKIDTLRNDYKKVEATDFIIEQAKKHQVVIINEAHHNSFHRVFTKSLLQRLFDNGYRNLGLEALTNGENSDSLLNSRKYPVQDSGLYIKDPQFGNLVRTALEIGYYVFPYETMNKEANGKLREIDQARNIEEVINSRPNEKFLIHSGFDHALEGDHDFWEKAMAGRLKEFTGIDPLTINQEFYSERSHPQFNHPMLKAFHVKKSSILMDEDNDIFKYEQGEAWTDIAVLHPNTKYIDNRPDWLFENDNKKVSINLTDIEIEYPVMVLAYKKGENINLAIPVDIIEVAAKTENHHLGLQIGDYEIVVTNGKESFKFEQQVR